MPAQDIDGVAMQRSSGISNRAPLEAGRENLLLLGVSALPLLQHAGFFDAADHRVCSVGHYQQPTGRQGLAISSDTCQPAFPTKDAVADMVQARIVLDIQMRQAGHDPHLVRDCGLFVEMVCGRCFAWKTACADAAGEYIGPGCACDSRPSADCSRWSRQILIAPRTA
jgi:hypothetical protein